MAEFPAFTNISQVAFNNFKNYFSCKSYIPPETEPTKDEVIDGKQMPGNYYNSDGEPIVVNGNRLEEADTSFCWYATSGEDFCGLNNDSLLGRAGETTPFPAVISHSGNGTKQLHTRVKEYPLPDGGLCIEEDFYYTFPGNDYNKYIGGNMRIEEVTDADKGYRRIFPVTALYNNKPTAPSVALFESEFQEYDCSISESEPRTCVNIYRFHERMGNYPLDEITSSASQQHSLLAGNAPGGTREPHPRFQQL